jgi:diguanylate cyclase (GGDEF)-like protein
LNPDGNPDVTDSTALEQALITLELKLDETFEAAEHRANSEDEGSGLIVEQVLDLVYTTLNAVIPYDRVGMAIVEDDGELMLSRWARSEATSLTMGSGHASPLTDDAVRAILAAREPLVVNDLEAYLEEHPDSAPTRGVFDEGMRSCLAFPLTRAGAPIGVMVFSSKKAAAYTDEHTAVFGRIADHLGTVLERSRLYERLVDLNWQLRVARDALQYQATHDALTGLWNRAAIIDKAGREIDRARRQQKPIAIVMCDIDDFKAINEEHGHRVGDAVLQGIAERLEDALRSYEDLGRYGGEEFFIALYDCGADDAPRAMERLREAIGREAVSTDYGDIAVTISLGGAVSSAATADIDALIRAAEAALGAAKEAGRNCHRVRLVQGGSS